MKVTCPSCQKHYNLNEAKIPLGVKTAKCKSCGHPVPLKPDKDLSPVHSLKKELSWAPAEKSGLTPIQASQKRDGFIIITCGNCRKKYKIRQSKIPPTATGLKCQACGNKIALPLSASLKVQKDQLQGDNEKAKERRARRILMSQEVPPPINAPRKKKWLFAAAAGIILVVIVTILGGLNLIKVAWLNRVLPDFSEKETEKAVFIKKEPFLVLNLNIPFILNIIENRIDVNKKTSQYRMTMSTLQSMRLNRLELYLYSGPENQVLPVILAKGGDPKYLKNLFSNQEPFKSYFKRKSDGNYLLKKDALDKENKYDLPSQPYQITVAENGAVFAPLSFANAIRENKELILNTHAARFVKSIETLRDLAAVAILISEDLYNGWEKKIQNHPAIAANPVTAKIAGMGSEIISLLTGSLKSVEVLALGFRFTENEGRTLSYAQQFRQDVDGESVYRQLASGNFKDAKVDGIIRNIIEFFQDQRLTPKLQFRENRLSVEFNWSKKDDDAFLAAISEATTEPLFARSKKLEPTDRPIRTQPSEENYLADQVDPDALKPEILLRVRDDHKPVSEYADFTEKDLTNLNVRWIEGHNQAVDSLAVQLPKGPFRAHVYWDVYFFAKNKPQDLMGNSVQEFKAVSYRLEKGSLKNIHAAFGRVQLNLQTNIKRLSFLRIEGSDPKPQTLPSGDKVAVGFNKNEITYRTGNANVIRTIAYDADGKRLKQDDYTRSKRGNRVVYFWGEPVKFEIVTSTKVLKKLIEFDIKQRQVDENAYQTFQQTVEKQREIVKTLKSLDRARRKDRSYYGDDLAGLYYIYDRGKKKPVKLIDPEIAHSDPAGQKRFGYRLKPYKDYYFTVLSGVAANGVNQSYKRRSQKTTFTWEKGTITTTPLTRHPDLVAIPEDKSQPTFFLQWGQVFKKRLNGEKLEYLPENYENSGWTEAKFIER
jgi:predicted Zn finger-like uncharacterized protein